MSKSFKFNKDFTMIHHLILKNSSPSKVVRRCYSFWWKDTVTESPNFSLVTPHERLPKVDISLFPEHIRKPDYALNGITDLSYVMHQHQRASTRRGPHRATISVKTVRQFNAKNLQKCGLWVN